MVSRASGDGRMDAICDLEQSNVLLLPDRREHPWSSWILTSDAVRRERGIDFILMLLHCCTAAPLHYSAVRSSPKAAGGLRALTHRLHLLPNDLVHLEEFCAASVDADGLALEEVALGVSVGHRVGLDALGVARVDQAVAAASQRGSHRHPSWMSAAGCRWRAKEKGG